MDVKNQQLLQDLYASIAMDVKNQHLLQNLDASIAMDVTLVIIMIPICEYCIFEMAL